MHISDNSPLTREQEGWLRLNILEFAPKRAQDLRKGFVNDMSTLWDSSEEVWKSRCPELTIRQIERMETVRKQDISSHIRSLQKSDAQLISFVDSRYPANLRELPDAPPLLLIKGDLIPEDKFSVAIVGSRRATQYGLSLAKRFSSDLASRGFSITSGGARGIDTAAHRGALDANGRTIAFLGSGVDISYPADNKRLFAEIANGNGALVSEFPMGTRPEPWRFPARNRLISGMSLGVLVIESPADSGSMITAREAADQGREVFAIPGPIDTGKSSGCHKLIQDGAKLVETLDDILNELGVLTLTSPDSPSRSLVPTTPIPNLPPEQRQVLDMLTLQPTHVDSIIEAIGLSTPQITGILTLLEMRGLTRRVAGNAFIRVL